MCCYWSQECFWFQLWSGAIWSCCWTARSPWDCTVRSDARSGCCWFPNYSGGRMSFPHQWHCYLWMGSSYLLCLWRYWLSFDSQQANVLFDSFLFLSQMKLHFKFPIFKSIIRAWKTLTDPSPMMSYRLLLPSCVPDFSTILMFTDLPAIEFWRNSVSSLCLF